MIDVTDSQQNRYDRRIHNPFTVTSTTVAGKTGQATVSICAGDAQNWFAAVVVLEPRAASDCRVRSKHHQVGQVNSWATVSLDVVEGDIIGVLAMSFDDPISEWWTEAFDRKTLYERSM